MAGADEEAAAEDDVELPPDEPQAESRVTPATAMAAAAATATPRRAVVPM